MLRVIAFCCLAVLTLPRGADAEWHLVPMVGFTTLGSTSVYDPELGTGRTHIHTGGSLAWLSRSIFGVEAVGIWTPRFFEGDPNAPVQVKSARAISLMGNVMMTLPQRWTEYGLRPFVSGGFGLMHAVQGSEVLPATINVQGFNIGGGAVGFLSDRTGVRFDVRYHSTLNRLQDAPSFGETHLRYVTASIGLVLRR